MIDDKIKELEKQLIQAKNEKINMLHEKYEYLIGKCLHNSVTSYQKITGIESIYSDEIYYNCIDIYYDAKLSSPEIRIDTHSCGYIYVDEIERYLISEEKFNEILNECLAILKKGVL